MSAYHWNWSVFLQEVPSGGETYLGWLLTGMQWTIAVSLSAWLLALLLGTALGVMRTLPNKLLAGLAATHVEVFRNIPLLVQLFIWFFVVPELLPATAGNWIKQRDPLTQQFFFGVVGLGLFTSARVGEQIRAGIQSLPKGQFDAGLALGFSLAQTYRHVLLPMAFRIVIPPLTSEFLNIFKNSAVVSVIGLLELTGQAKQLVEYTAQPYESFAAATLGYLLINVVVMMGMRGLERHFQVPGRIEGQRQ